MKLKSILDKILLNESLQQDLDGVIEKLESYQHEYSKENDKESADIIRVTLDLLQQKKYAKSLDNIWNSKLRYDISNTLMEFKRIVTELHLQANYDPQWGQRAGEYIGFHAGPVHEVPNGLFFSIDQEGAVPYSHGGRRELKKYKVMIKRPLVAKSLYSALSILTGKGEQYFTDQKNKSNNVSKWWISMDEKVVKLASAKGYDSVLYTNPAPPAKKELVIFNSNQVKEI